MNQWEAQRGMEIIKKNQIEVINRNIILKQKMFRNNRKLKKKKSLVSWKTETLKPWQLKNLREILKLIT